MKRRDWLVSDCGIFNIVLSLFLLGLACGVPNVPRMSKEELRAKLGDPSLVIVDVRAGAHWNAEERKIEGSVRVDPSLADSLMDKYSSDTTFVFYCA